MSAGCRRGLAGLALLVAIGGIFAWIHRHRMADLLVRADPAQILRDPTLRQAAVELGLPVYRTHCASCHGAALQGNHARGVPDLAANAWLYGSDPLGVERTILYGIRSGHPKSRNVTDMPAMVRSGQITTDEAKAVGEFLESLAGRPYDRVKAQRGHALYDDKGNCFDCHARDARGVSDYGAPALTGPVWLYGGDRETLFLSILNGRHGLCPAWVNRLTPLQIRAVTLYIVSASRAVTDRH